MVFWIQWSRCLYIVTWCLGIVGLVYVHSQLVCACSVFGVCTFSDGVWIQWGRCLYIVTWCLVIVCSVMVSWCLCTLSVGVRVWWSSIKGVLCLPLVSQLSNASKYQ